MTRQVVFELLSKIPVIRKNIHKNKSYAHQHGALQVLKRATSMNDFITPKALQKKPGSQASNFSVPGQSTMNQDQPPTLHLRGQMKYIKNWGRILYICSPL